MACTENSFTTRLDVLSKHRTDSSISLKVMNSQLMKYHVFNRQGSLLFTKVFNWGFFYCSYDSCFWPPSVEMKRRILAYLKTFDSRKGIPLPIITISFYYYHFFLWIRTIFAGFFFPNPPSSRTRPRTRNFFQNGGYKKQISPHLRGESYVIQI